MAYEINWEGNKVVFFTNVSFEDVIAASKEIGSKIGKEISIEVKGEKMSREDFIGKYAEVSTGEDTITGTITEFTTDGIMIQDKNDDNNDRRVTDLYFIPMRSINCIHHNVDGEY